MKKTLILLIILATSVATAYPDKHYAPALEAYAKKCQVNIDSLKIDSIEESDQDYDYIAEVVKLSDGGSVTVTTTREEVRDGPQGDVSVLSVNGISCTAKSIFTNMEKVLSNTYLSHELYNPITYIMIRELKAITNNPNVDQFTTDFNVAFLSGSSKEYTLIIKYSLIAENSSAEELYGHCLYNIVKGNRSFNIESHNCINQ